MDTKKIDKPKINWMYVVNGLVIVVIAAVFYWGSRPSSALIDGDTIKLTGMYGVEVAVEDVVEVELSDKDLNIRSRVNGINILGMRKGTYNMEELGRARLVVHSLDAPFIYIHTDENIYIINFREAEMTESLYGDILDVLERPPPSK